MLVRALIVLLLVLNLGVAVLVDRTRSTAVARAAANCRRVSPACNWWAKQPTAPRGAPPAAAAIAAASRSRACNAPPATPMAAACSRPAQQCFSFGPFARSDAGEAARREAASRWCGRWPRARQAHGVATRLARVPAAAGIAGRGAGRRRSASARPASATSSSCAKARKPIRSRSAATVARTRRASRAQALMPAGFAARTEALRR